MAHDVFISYSSHDKPTADAVCSTLEGNGVRCWIAPRDILPGMDWTDAIIDAITACKVFVLVLSGASNSSEQVKREVQIAVGEGMPILPFRIEEVDLSKHMKYFIGTPHWMDALSPPMEAHLLRMANTVRALLEASAAHEAGSAAPPVAGGTAPQLPRPAPAAPTPAAPPQPTPAPQPTPTYQPTAPPPMRPQGPPPGPQSMPPAAAYGQAPAYRQQGQAYPTANVPPWHQNGSNILMLSVVGLLCCPVCSIVALIFGMQILGGVSAGRIDPRQRGNTIGAMVLAAGTLVMWVFLWMIGAAGSMLNSLPGNSNTLETPSESTTPAWYTS